LNLRPSGYEGEHALLPGGSSKQQTLAEHGVTARPDSRQRQQMAPGQTGFAAPVLLAGVRGSGADEPLLTVKEVAARLKVSTATVYKLVDRGDLACVRVANSIRVRAGVLAAYLAQ
jgi:excisionase family DNA binding protein